MMCRCLRLSREPFIRKFWLQESTQTVFSLIIVAIIQKLVSRWRQICYPLSQSHWESDCLHLNQIISHTKVSLKSSRIRKIHHRNSLEVTSSQRVVSHHIWRRIPFTKPWLHDTDLPLSCTSYNLVTFENSTTRWEVKPRENLGHHLRLPPLRIVCEDSTLVTEDYELSILLALV
jgi:hypothetical protein